MTTKKRPVKKRVWTNRNYVVAYEYARAGLNESQLADAMGVNRLTLRKWRADDPDFHDAILRGRSFRERTTGATISFHEYVFNRLPPDLKELWEEIAECETAPNGLLRMEAMFAEQGIRVRQHLFLYALTSTNFNASEACRRVGISKSTLDDWVRRDPKFAELMDEIHWHKGNFFEDKLITLVNAYEPTAVIMANKTFNKDRGYGQTVEVKHSGHVNHAHAVVTVGELQLPLGVRQAILVAMRDHQQQSNLPALGAEPIEVEVEA